MIKIAICDDAISCLSDLRRTLEKYDFKEEYKIYEYLTGTELLEDMPTIRFDIVIMDVELEGENGIEIASKVKAIDRGVILLYASFYSIYFQDMVRTEPFGFIDKNGGEKKVFETMDRVMKRINILRRKKFFSFSAGGADYVIDLNEVLYFCSEHRIVHIKMIDGSEYRFYEKLDNIQIIVDGIHPFFARPSKSYLINVFHAVRHKKWVDVKGEELSITKKYHEEFNEKWIEIMREGIL